LGPTSCDSFEGLFGLDFGDFEAHGKEHSGQRASELDLLAKALLEDVLVHG
jgi:hypothetical protein